MAHFVDTVIIIASIALAVDYYSSLRIINASDTRCFLGARFTNIGAGLT
jgi:hypothetical protein